MNKSAHARLIARAAGDYLPRSISASLILWSAEYCEDHDPDVYARLVTTARRAAVRYPAFASKVGLFTPPRMIPEELERMMPGTYWGRYKARLLISGRTH